MKANELMLGDLWILKSNGKLPDSIVRIREIHVDGCFVDVLENDTFELCDNFIDYFELSPIPLTKEILMVNGWTEFCYGHFEDENHLHFRRGFDRRLELSLMKGDNCFCTNFSLGRIDFYYVHELQHVLRLCGLNDLANNLKVE